LIWSTIVWTRKLQHNAPQHKISQQAPTPKNSKLTDERHRLGGGREKSAKNMWPVLHDYRPFIKLWSQKLYKIFYHILRYFY
jgi:hypothetical protein